jgi:hypothetical protein
VVFYGERKASDQPLANAPKADDALKEASKDAMERTK